MSTDRVMSRAEMLDAMSAALPPIKCGGCTACCKHDRIVLGPTDSREAFRWHVENGHAVLDRKPNGNCIYLTPAGCGIYGKAPSICARFDCRVLLQVTPLERRTVRVRQNPQMAHIYAAGGERLRALGIQA